MTCEGCRTVRYCSHRCQKKHWRHHIRDCWFRLNGTDMSGRQLSIGPVRASTPCQAVREAAAEWKKVSPRAVNLIYGTHRLMDGHTLGSWGIRKDQDVTIVITLHGGRNTLGEPFTKWLLGMAMPVPCRCHGCRNGWGREWIERAADGPGEMEDVD